MRKFIFDSQAAAIARAVTGSQDVSILYDQACCALQCRFWVFRIMHCPPCCRRAPAWLAEECSDDVAADAFLCCALMRTAHLGSSS